jgi:putative ABC transport system substrate-binding protein
LDFRLPILDFREKQMQRKFRIQFGCSCSDNLKSKIQNRKWLGLSVIAFVILSAGAAARAQQPKKIARIGLLGGMSTTTFADRMKVFRQQLRNLGYSEGKNIVFEERWAEGNLDRLSELAAELVKAKVDVLVTFGGTAPAMVAKNATSTIPIVMAAGGTDPVKAGLVASLARPGGNMTGLANSFTELRGKQMELLKETIPKLFRIAVVWNPDSPAGSANVRETESEARALGLRIQSLEVRKVDHFENVFQSAKKEHAGAVLITTNPMFSTHIGRIAGLTIKHRLPAIQAQKEFVDAGGLMMYGPSGTEIYRRAAIYIDKILKGAKPGELPVERPSKFEFIINLKTAKQIGLTIPPNVLARADRVIR